MKKILFFILILLMNHSLYANDCEAILNKHKIDPTIRSINGWKRTIKNQELYQYIKNIDQINVVDKIQIKQCLIQQGFNIATLTRGIGVQK